MSKQITFSIADSLTKLGKSLESVESSLEEETNRAIKDLAFAAYSKIIAKAQAELNSTRQDYIKNVQFQELSDNTFLISLEGDWAAALEDGFPSYNLTEKLLKSKKTVEIGSRSGNPWVQESKKGNKFAHVPIQRNPFTKAPKGANMVEAIQQMTAMNAQGRKQKITKIFTDSQGMPLEGKVAIGKSENPLYNQLVKYQKIYKNDAGKETVQSIYINFRTISEAGKPWIHPGYTGIHAFDDAEKYIIQQIDNIISNLL